MKYIIIVLWIYNTNAQIQELTQQEKILQILNAESKRESSEDWVLDPVVQVRWDFADCGKSGMMGPTQGNFYFIAAVPFWRFYRIL